MRKLILILMTFNSTIMCYFLIKPVISMLLFQGKIKDNFNLYHSHMAKRSASVS